MAAADLATKDWLFHTSAALPQPGINHILTQAFYIFTKYYGQKFDVGSFFGWQNRDPHWTKWLDSGPCKTATGTYGTGTVPYESEIRYLPRHPTYLSKKMNQKSKNKYFSDFSNHFQNERTNVIYILIMN